MFTTSLSKLMASVSNMLSRLFGGSAKNEKPVLTQATKLEAAYTSIKALDVSSGYSMQYSKSDTCKFTAMAKNLPEFIEYLQGYALLLASNEGLRISDIRGAPTTVTLTEFLTKDGFYVPLIAVSEFHRVSSEILESLIKHKDKETGKESYHIRMLGNTLVSIRNISDAFASCKKHK